jgi:hypothetical protein
MMDRSWKNLDALLWFQLMNLLNVHGQTTSGVQSARAHVAFKVLSFLVLHQD